MATNRQTPRSPCTVSKRSDRARPEFVPTKDDFHRAHAQLATGDPGELKDVAEELADLWPGWGGCWPGYFYGYNAADDDD